MNSSLPHARFAPLQKLILYFKTFPANEMHEAYSVKYMLILLGK
jgi:hypothetical protein